MALAGKRQRLYDLRPDIVVIPECSKDSLELSLNDGFDGRWFGDNPRRGLGVLVAKPLRITRTQRPRNRWIVPLSISGGACDFRLIGSGPGRFKEVKPEAISVSCPKRWSIIRNGSLPSNSSGVAISTVMCFGTKNVKRASTPPW